MIPKNPSFLRALLAVSVAAGLVAGTTNTQAQQVLTPASYAAEISIDIPQAAATGLCTAVPAGAPVDKLVVKKTFAEMFDKLDLKTNRWTPHYDGGYDAVTKTWLGYDWITKRTQPAAHEQQLYVDPGYKGTTRTPLGINPFIIKDGVLHIVAQRTPATLLKALSNFEYTSGVLTTRKSHVQRYGYFEARVLVPSTQALLPAFWMLPHTKAWPPELDVMEAPTHEADTILQTSHWLNAAGAHAASGCRTKYPGYSAGFHQYGAYWSPTKIVYYIDRIPVGQMLTPPGMTIPMYMQINLAVGGDWVGKATSATPIPVEMLVDNVVAYSIVGPSECAVLENGVTQCPAN
ncbi:MAG: glycoside hydrolase family 16 protein [Pseudomonadota bacterium]